MLCQHCKQNEATTHIRRVVNGAAEEFHLCAACAKQAGIGVQFSAPEFGIHLSDLFSGFLGSSLRGQGQSQPPPARCALCGSSLQEIIQNSRVGCAQCYETFSEQLQPTLQRIHGALKHAGKAPEADPAVTERKQRQARADQLRAEIAQAVRAEDYEQAARLRDEIRRLEEGGESHA